MPCLAAKRAALSRSRAATATTRASATLRAGRMSAAGAMRAAPRMPRRSGAVVVVVVVVVMAPHHNVALWFVHGSSMARRCAARARGGVQAPAPRRRARSRAAVGDVVSGAAELSRAYELHRL